MGNSHEGFQECNRDRGFVGVIVCYLSGGKQPEIPQIAGCARLSETCILVFEKHPLKRRLME